MNYKLVQNSHEVMYLKAHVVWTISFCNERDKSQTYLSRASRVLNNLLLKSLLNFAHIFSAGFNSGLYGGRKTRQMLSGTLSDFALWKAPLSKTIILHSSGLCLDISSRKI